MHLVSARGGCRISRHVRKRRHGPSLRAWGLRRFRYSTNRPLCAVPARVGVAARRTDFLNGVQKASRVGVGARPRDGCKNCSLSLAPRACRGVGVRCFPVRMGVGGGARWLMPPGQSAPEARFGCRSVGAAGAQAKGPPPAEGNPSCQQRPSLARLGRGRGATHPRSRRGSASRGRAGVSGPPSSSSPRQR